MKGIFILATSILLLSFASCRNSERDLDTGTEDSREFWVAANQFSNIIREVHRVAVVDSILNGIDSIDVVAPENCVDTFYRNPDVGPFPIDLQIVYSDTVTCDASRTKTGRLNVRFSGIYTNYGTTITISPDSFALAGVFFTGDIVMQMVGKTADSIIYNVSVSNGSIRDAKVSAKNVSSWQGNFSIVQYNGRTTITSLDDNFLYYGNGSGIASNGIIYEFWNTEWANLDADCNYENSGEFKIVSTNSIRQDRFCKFGNGACDNKMTVSIPPVNGDYEVTIR